MVVVAAVVVQSATAPGQTLGVSVFVDHLVDDLGITRSTLSSAYMVGTLTGALVMTRVGRFLDRRGPRRGVGLFGIAFGLVLAAMAGVNSLPLLVIGFIGIRALGQGSLTLTASTAVAIGFERRRGTAVGVMSAASAALMALVPLVATGVIAVVGWRWTWVILAGAVWLALLPVAASPILRRRPLPHAERIAPDVGIGTAADDWTHREALGAGAYWTVLTAVALTALVLTGLTFHHVNLLAERGLSATEAATNFLPQTLAGLTAALLIGRLADRVAERLLLATTLLSLVAAPLLVMHVQPGMLALVYGLVLGSAAPAIRAVEATVLPRWFGTAHIGEIRGTVMAVMVASSAAGPLALAVSLDQLGSYVPGLYLFAAAAAILTIVSATMRPPMRRAPSPLPALAT